MASFGPLLKYGYVNRKSYFKSNIISLFQLFESKRVMFSVEDCRNYVNEKTAFCSSPNNQVLEKLDYAGLLSSVSTFFD